ncbi:hypothetical protein FHX08_002078 [Rhizobium sp. BK529]|uniref:hypothetical protein n=1 Tax=Rhizobium sp. BK529 TaxID=2586983 RepID=UPI00161DA284|nr:hypothetical protein [Rhizobium sp. BK529]MBB3591734.1 hypothetical protein [Rhizobium sp. BK529]
MRIDDNLKAIRSAHSGTGRPSYAVAGTTWISTAEAGKLKWYDFDGTVDHLTKTLDLATGEITYGDGTNADGTAAAIAAALSDPTYLQALKWRSKAIGERYEVDTSKAGAEIPPSNTADTVWIELTAGLTGVGGFNNGKLTSESISGTVPLVVATAVVSFGASPMNGQTIDLLNTEGRIARPSTSPGTKQNDAFQSHRVNNLIADISSSSGGTNIALSTSPSIGASQSGPLGTSSMSITTDGVNGTPRVANETRMKNVGIKAYMRIA